MVLSKINNILGIMAIRNVNMKCRITIVELRKERHLTGSIKEILNSRYGIPVSKRWYKKCYKFIVCSIYDDKKPSGRRRNYQNVTANNSQNKGILLINITMCFNVEEGKHIYQYTINRILIKYG